MDELNKTLKKYDYQLPKRLIANEPASPRDAAKLLVYNEKIGKPATDIFAHLERYLPKNAVLVLNQTKVWPARLMAQKPTGGKVELLYISSSKTAIKVLANKKLAPKMVISIAANHSGKSAVNFTVLGRSGQFYMLKPSVPAAQISHILKRYGVTPLPPYIKHSRLSEAQRRQQYQSVFAKAGLSVAAPTASLHFTKRLLHTLQKQGIAIAFTRLDVGLGTFAPLKAEHLAAGKLHREFYSIDKKTAALLNRAKSQRRPIIAVGTTVVRTLESAATARGKISKLSGDTSLFIREGYKFRFVDGLITNFHVPQSSLLMLVSAFIGRQTILCLYSKAIKNNFRFFSFGDGMLLLPKRL